MRQAVVFGAAAAMFLGAPLRAVAQAPATGGGVEGDVYLTMQSGDVKKGAGVTVFLLRDGPELRRWTDAECGKRVTDITILSAYMSAMVDSIIRAGSSRTKADLYIKKAADAATQKLALQKETLAAFRATVARNSIDTSGTGMNAHYSFSGEPPDDYVLFGEWKIGEYQYAWWAPVSLVAGKVVRRDLDNSTEDHENIYCGGLVDGQ